VDELKAALSRVVESGRYVLGPEVEAFERQVAEALGVRHAIGVSSGTDALLCALLAVGVGPGDEVVLPAFTFFATASAVRRTGATPVLCDIDPDTFNLDVESAASVCTERTRAVIPVHLFGQAADIDALRAALPTEEIAIVEDAAQAIGASYRGRPVGALGTLGCFSFYPTKNLGGLGDGGLVTTEDDDLAARCRLLRVHGDPGGYRHELWGGNFRLDALQAAALAVKLPHLEPWTVARREHAAGYRHALLNAGVAAPDGAAAEAGQLVLPAVRFERHVFNQFVVRVPRASGGRDAVRARLAERGVPTQVYYPRPLHHQPCLRDFGYTDDALPESCRAAEEVMALPIFPALHPDERARVVEALVEVLGAGCA